MTLNKKSITQSRDPGVDAWIGNVSKAFLADLVIDLIRRNEGSEDLDGADLLRAIVEDAEPIAVARQDRLPAPDYWEQEMLKQARRKWVVSAPHAPKEAMQRAHDEHVASIKRTVMEARPDFEWPKE